MLFINEPYCKQDINMLGTINISNISDHSVGEIVILKFMSLVNI